VNKSIFSLSVVAMLVVLSLSFVSAIPICATIETTYVSGTITDQSTGDPVSGASVDVTCNGNLKSTTSGADGGYSVQYLASECDYNDTVSVSASYDSLSGSSDSVDWYTQNSQIGCLEMIVNVACANVPLIPEFGIAIGTLTMAGAIVAFFIIRRK